VLQVGLLSFKSWQLLRGCFIDCTLRCNIFYREQYLLIILIQLGGHSITAFFSNGAEIMAKFQNL